jgi:replication factor A1
LQQATELIEKIISSSGKSKREVEQLIKAKKSKLSGLLTDDGAAFMVARELGIELATQQEMHMVSIGQLQDGMQNVDLLVRAMHVFSPKSFERNGTKGTLCNMIIADDSGETRLTLWHNDVRKMQEAGVQKGSVLLLHNCYVKSFNNKPQLNLSYNGSMVVEPKNVDCRNLPNAEERQSKLSELRAEMNEVATIVRVLRLFPVTEFEKESGKGRVMNFLVADESATIRATAWNDLVDAAEKLQENDLVKFEGAYTKEGLQGIELHLGWRARILANPKTDAVIPSAMQLMQDKTESRRISELDAAAKFVALQAAVVAVNQGQLRYSVCAKCGAKMQRGETGMQCEKCGSTEQDIRPVLSVRLDDGSSQINAVAYGQNAEKLMGCSKEELRQMLEATSPEQIIQQLQDKLVGKQVRAFGSAKENTFSNELEFVVRSLEFA